MSQKISLCMIVKDEASRIERCLASFRAAADDIVVLDTGSADGTPDLAARAGARVFSAPWEGDFSKARNISLGHATGGWVLWADADDVITPENAGKIRTVAARYELNCCFSFMIKNSTDGIMGSVFNQVRMFPRHEKIRFRFKVHEQVLPSIQELGHRTYYTDIQVIHTGYTSPEVVRQKQLRNLAILDAQMREHPDQPVIVYSYAGTLVDLDRLEEAVPHYERAMALAAKSGRETHIRDGVPVALAGLFGRLKKFDLARQWAGRAYAIDPAHPQVNAMLGELSESGGDLPAAVRHFEFVLTCGEKPTFLPVDVNALKLTACTHLASLYLKQGAKVKAVEILERALEIKTGRKLLPSERGDVYFNQGDHLKAGQAYLEAVNDAGSGDPGAFLGLGKIFILDNAVKDAIHILKLGLEKFPGHEELSMLLADLYHDIQFFDQARLLYTRLAQESRSAGVRARAQSRLS